VRRPETAQREEKSPPPVEPEDEPLRLRPPKSLRLEDFKINPRYLGAEYAFADTLRGRDQRRCLKGCTKPECCGADFLAMVQAGGVDVGSDSEVLTAYFGSNWQQIARASAFANKYGKHRNAFERRSTPPGFWRTEMPTTQEVEDDRIRAREVVSEKVEERWREAMRDGGRWLFRDE
ncbi:hypothetical protein BAUCODRAFT_70304, partial [Baudoinia panamericana UAMH 10762]